MATQRVGVGVPPLTPLTPLRPVNLSAFGLDNGLGYEGGAEVFHPVADPSGLITCTVTRK